MDDDDRAAQRSVRLTGLAAWLFARGHAADLILAVMLVEAVWLTWVRDWRASDAALRLLPGGLMVLAVRAALIGMAWPWVALALAASFPVHMADIMRGPGRR